MFDPELLLVRSLKKILIAKVFRCFFLTLLLWSGRTFFFLFLFFFVYLIMSLINLLVRVMINL